MSCPLRYYLHTWSEIAPDMELENFKVLVQVEAGVGEDIAFLHNGNMLTGDKKTMAELGLKDGDMLLYGPMSQFTGGQQTANPRPQQRQAPPAANPGLSSGIDWGAIQVPGAGQQRQSSARPQSSNSRQQQRSADDPETIRQLLLSDPHQLALLKERNPRLADALMSANGEEFLKVLEEQRQSRATQDQERIRLLTADPFDMEAQAKIAEEIRLENVNANMQTAMEYTPENFAEVYMLYINVNVNGHSVKAFVDSGAQMTIMSKACAERCNVMRLMDSRWQGMAVGVGTQKILGRVHMGQLQVEESYFTTSFTILENQPMDMLLGLDMLKRHQCCIDLKDNCLRIGTTGIATKFLSESEIPKRQEQAPNAANDGSADNVASNAAGEPMDEDVALQEAILKSQAEGSK